MGGRFRVIMVLVICMDEVSTISKTHGEKRKIEKGWRTERERGREKERERVEGGGREKEREE